MLPYLHLDIDDEDSLSQRLENKEQGLIDIVVIRLPRISNFTDFGPLERIHGVQVRYIDKVQQLGNPDAVILPGTKNTMEDLLWMRQNGLEAAVKKFAQRGGIVFGICGGYQMLGQTLRDPHEVEYGGQMYGMGLLPMTTVFGRRKGTAIR